MPQPVSMAVRQSIIDRYLKDEKICVIAQDLEVSRGTVYALINRHKSQGDEGLKTSYAPCGKKPPSEQEFIYRAVRMMRHYHPKWGAEKIRAEITLLRPQLELPHCRTFNRWFHKTGQLDIALKSSLPKEQAKLAKRLHEIWQVDAKEEMKIANGTKQCWLNITDEFSGTVISPPVFSL
jgi:hypothetical protein